MKGIELKNLTKKYKDTVKKYERENDLISQTDRWNMEYLSEKEKMPMFPEGEDVDTHWMNLMDNLATTNYIAISRRQYGKEVSKGDVFELPVEVSGWEGSLEGLVKFLWDVQSNGQSMMDVSAITMRPSQNRRTHPLTPLTSPSTFGNRRTSRFHAPKWLRSTNDASWQPQCAQTSVVPIAAARSSRAGELSPLSPRASMCSGPVCTITGRCRSAAAAQYRSQRGDAGSTHWKDGISFRSTAPSDTASSISSSTAGERGSRLAP